MSSEQPLGVPPEGVERRPVTLASRLLLGGPVVLVTSSFRGKHNVMPLAWLTPLSSDPPLIGIAVEQSRHSAEMISHAEEFALNFPTRALMHHVQYLGALSGENVDKLEATQLETFDPVHVTAPLIRGCAAWIECEVKQVIPAGDHLLFVGLPVCVHVDPEAFGERWLLEDEEARPLHFLGGNAYSVLAAAMEARSPRPAEAPERELARMVADDLELTRESRERREEQMGQLEREVEEGNLIDVSRVRMDQLPDPDAPLRIVIPEPEDET